jgi:hypothetical protein
MTLAVTLAGCAGHAGSTSVTTHPGAQSSAWQQQMDLARRMAAEGKTYVMVGPSGIFAFYNTPRPFCYTYMIPGEWQGTGPGEYRSKDGRAFVWVSFVLAEGLEDVEGANLVERARAMITRQYEKTLGQSLTGVELVPFESARPGTWKWKAATAGFTHGGHYYRFPTRIIVDLSPYGVMHFTVDGAQDNDGLARRVIENVRTTLEPECYWPVLEAMLKAMHGER